MNTNRSFYVLYRHERKRTGERRGSRGSWACGRRRVVRSGVLSRNFPRGARRDARHGLCGARGARHFQVLRRIRRRSASFRAENGIFPLRGGRCRTARPFGRGHVYPRALPRTHLRVQGYGARCFAPSLEEGLRASWYSRKYPRACRHQRRYGQGGARRLQERRGDQNSGILSQRGRVVHATYADVHAGGRKRVRRCRQGKFRRLSDGCQEYFRLRGMPRKDEGTRLSALFRQLHQRGAADSAGGILLFRVLRPRVVRPDRYGRQGRLCRTYGQFRQYSGGVLRKANGTSRGKADMRLQQE